MYPAKPQFMQGGRNCLLKYDEKKLRSEQDFISRETEKHTQDSKNTYQKAPDISQFPSRNLMLNQLKFQKQLNRNTAFLDHIMAEVDFVMTSMTSVFHHPSMRTRTGTARFLR